MDQEMKKTTTSQWIGIISWGFLLASLIGWIYEELCGLIMFGTLMERGILWLPLCPIYGFGAWLLYSCAKKICKKIPAILLLTAVISGIFEYICSYVLEEYFHLYLWNYEGWIGNINHRISLLSCFFFGILAVLFIKGIVPFLQFCSRKLPKVLFVASGLIGLLVVAADLLGCF